MLSLTRALLILSSILAEHAKLDTPKLEPLLNNFPAG